MSAKIIPFTGITKLDLDPDLVLEGAKGKLEGLLIVGWDLEGEFYGASTFADGPTLLWLMEVCKKRLLDES